MRSFGYTPRRSRPPGPHPVRRPFDRSLETPRSKRFAELRKELPIKTATAPTLNCGFTAEDPKTWEAAWSGEVPWPTAEGRLYEYACHEGNYALGNIMRGVRLLEADAAVAATGGE